MAKLNNQELIGGFATDISKSFGPFIATADNRCLFNNRIREYPLWLGHNAGALFGLTQFRESWTNEKSDTFDKIEAAYDGLLDRIKNSICGQVKLKPREDLPPGGLLYCYIGLSVLDQFANEHKAIADETERRFQQLLGRYGDLLASHYVDGPNFEFGFEFVDDMHFFQFAKEKTAAGIYSIAWPKMSKHLRFFLNLSYRKTERDLFWSRMELLFRSVKGDAIEFEEVEIAERKNQAPSIEFHKSVVRAKATRELKTGCQVVPFLEERLKNYSDEPLDVVVLNQDRYHQHRDKILALQTETYEPVRRTPPEEFDLLFASNNPLGLLVLQDANIVAMAFAGQLNLFSRQRGVESDPFFNDPSVYYSMDLTITPSFRGGFGSVMKQALILLAIENGVTAIHGRNRDRLARSMWAINLSLGSFELQHLPDDYPDDKPYRDCIYYRCPLQWHGSSPKEADKIIEGGMLMKVNGIGLKNVVID